MCISHKYWSAWLQSPLAVETSGCSSPPLWVNCDLYLTRINQSLSRFKIKWFLLQGHENFSTVRGEASRHHTLGVSEILGWKVNVLEGLTESTGQLLALVKASKLLRKALTAVLTPSSVLGTGLGSRLQQVRSIPHKHSAENTEVVPVRRRCHLKTGSPQTPQH